MSERNRKMLTRLAAAVASIAALALGIGLAIGARSPTYQGRGVKDWFQLLGSESEVERKAAAEALDALGCDCLPYLLSQVEVNRPDLKERIESWVRQKMFHQFPRGGDCGLMAASEAAARAYRLRVAFETLGVRAVPAARRLRALLRDPLCSYDAGVSLAGMGEDGLKKLEDAFQNERADVRRIVVSALENAKVEQPKAVELLLQALKDTDGLVRHYAAHGLGQLAFSPGRTVPALATALEDTDPRVRWMAAYSLGRFGSAGASALPAIHRLQNDADEQVRKCAAEVAQSLEGIAQAQLQ